MVSCCNVFLYNACSDAFFNQWIYGAFMNLKKLFLAIFVIAIQIPNNAQALLGPIKITLNTEYRTSTPVIGPIATSIRLNKSDIKKTGASTFTGLLETIPAVSFEGGQGNLTAFYLIFKLVKKVK